MEIANIFNKNNYIFIISKKKLTEIISKILCIPNGRFIGEKYDGFKG